MCETNGLCSSVRFHDHVCKVYGVRRFVTDAEAIAQALQQAWPLLEKGFTQHKGNVRAIERYAR